jgi:hypothetical protein
MKDARAASCTTHCADARPVDHNRHAMVTAVISVVAPDDSA